MADNILSFSDIYDIKKFMIEQIAPKYFEMEDVNQYNVGLLGYTTEVAAVTTEESFNALNTMFKEIFITKATLPETIYTEAGIYGVDSIAANPAKTKTFLYVKQKDILNFGTFDGDVYDFTIDKNTIIDVSGIPFTLDYDVRILARPDRGDFIITAQYMMSETNTISVQNHQFIKTYRSNITDELYLGLVLDVRQYVRTTIEENIITSNNINFPTITVNYEDMYAGMDVYYKAPNTDEFILLTKRSTGTTPLRTPFVYYAHTEDGTLELTFTTRDNYFKPAFNSELRIVVYSTLGTQGNFKEYTGNNVNVIGSGERFDYNGSVVMFSTTLGSSLNGGDTMSLEDLRLAVIDKKSSAGSYTTESDLETYFNNAASKMENIFLKFIKRRDDLVERLFSCFGLFLDDMGDYYHSNTLHLKVEEEDFDRNYDNGNRFIIKPGRYIKYDGTSLNSGVLFGNKCVANNDDIEGEEFVFANPFLISMQKNPNSISFYQNAIDSIHTLEYAFSEYLSKYQFMVNNITVQRNSIKGEQFYTVRTKLKPTFDIEVDDAGDPNFGTDIKIVLTINNAREDSKALIMEQVEFDQAEGLLTFECIIETDDEMNLNDNLVVNNVYDADTGLLGIGIIPMDNAVFNVCIFAKDDSINTSHSLTMVEDLKDYSLIGRYSTVSERVTLMKSMKYMKAPIKFVSYSKGEDPESGEAIMDYYANIELIPVVGLSVASDDTRMRNFLADVQYVYDSVSTIMNFKTNNYSIDMKFYGTYGRSKNFVIGEEEDLLDKTNIQIEIDVAYAYGTIIETETNAVKRYIKNYVENINKSKSQEIDLRGYNGVFISNLTQELENTFPAIRYMKFKSINSYGPYVQIVQNKSTDIATLDNYQRREYVPEFLTIGLGDITVNLL